MFLRIFRNDFRRKKTMNIIIFLFIILSTVFVSGGVSNLVTVMNDLDYYFDKAGIDDYVVITMGDNSVGCLDELLKEEESILSYKIEPVVYAGQKTVTDLNDNELKTKNITLLQSIESAQINFFDRDDYKIDEVSKGYVYVSGNFLKENNLNASDKIRINHSGVELILTIAGIAKDALLGSDFMGNYRLIINDEDMRCLLDNEEIYEHYRGEICYIDTDNISEVSSALAGASNIAFDGSRSLIKMCYVMDIIIVLIMLVLSICLILVSFVVLKFSITFSISEEYREIGMMKAIGLKNRKIRFLYIVKYLVLGICGAIAGVLFSFPYSRLLMKAVSDKLVLGNNNEILFHLMGGILVIALIVLFAYHCTRLICKSAPIDAIRQGQTGERYQTKTILKRAKWRGKNASFMAANDILSKPRRYLSIVISFGICTLFVLMLVNTTSTMKSSKLIKTFGTETDLYITDVESVMEYMTTSTKEEYKRALDEMSDKLNREGMPNYVCGEVQYKYPVTVKGKDYLLQFQQGINTKITDYEFTEGTPPRNEREIAITTQVSEKTGAKIGDVITIHYGGQDMDCMVTAYFQTMNNLGDLVRLYDTAPAEFANVSSIFQYQIQFTDNPTANEIEIRKERVKKIFETDAVENTTEYCISAVGVVDTMEGVQALLLIITLVVVILVTILMERSFISEEKNQIALLKAVGFRDYAIIKWHVIRFGLVSLAAVFLAAILSIPMTKLCISPIFGMMGASRIEYNILPLQIFGIYPGIVLLATITLAFITALYTKTIKSSDIANIE